MSMTPHSRRRLLFNAAFIFTVASVLWGISMVWRSKRTESNGSSTAYVALGDSTRPIRILVDLSPEDFGIEETGKVGGFQVKLAKQLFKDMVIRWLPVTNQRTAFEYLRKGRADIYASSFPLSRKQDLEVEGMSMSIPLFGNSWVLIGHYAATSPMAVNNSDSTYHIALSEDDIGAQIILSNIIELSYPYLKADILEMSELDIALSVARKTHKYAVINRELASEMTRRYPKEIRIIQDISFNTQQVWLVRSDDSAILHLLNDKIIENLGRE